MRIFRSNLSSLSFLKNRPRISRVGFLSTVNLQNIYSAKVTEGNLNFDENQFKLIKLLNKISIHLVDLEANNINDNVNEKINIEINDQKPGDAIEVKETLLEKRARGLYIFGSVGIGKTVIMDMFFENCEIKLKKRVHFHQFMLEIHQKIHLYKKDLLTTYGRELNLNLSSERDAISQVAESIAKESKLLCFDEFQVTDICDAMILSKLFAVLWSKGTVLIATSNRPPSDLYKDGLNRSYFIPFITQLERECMVKEIPSDKDYRQLNLPLLNSYFTPLSDSTKADLFDSFNSHSQQYCANGSESHEGSSEIAIPVMMGRTVKVTVNQKSSGACYVDFKYLCETDRGASDYHAICKHFDTVFLHGIPQLSVLEHDRARRFITLIDEVYDAGIHLVWSAEMEPNMMFRELTPVEIIVEKKEGKAFGTDHGWGKDPNKVEKKSGNPWLDQNSKNDTYAAVSHIYQGVDASNDELKLLEGELSSVQELKFAFKRAASRLTEMAGSEYLKNWTIKYNKI